jgi:hypothetical protein
MLEFECELISTLYGKDTVFLEGGRISLRKKKRIAEFSSGTAEVAEKKI